MKLILKQTNLDVKLQASQEVRKQTHTSNIALFSRGTTSYSLYP